MEIIRLFILMLPLFSHSKEISAIQKSVDKSCEVGMRSTCPANTVCAKVDSSGRTGCGEFLEEPPIIFLLPFDSKTSVICTQSSENPKGTHGFKNMLFAIDLTTPYSKKASIVRASADGTAFVFEECKTPKGTPEKSDVDNCGLGLGNHIRVLHEGGYVSFYVHLEKAFVKSGDEVKAGQQIGIEGWTGQAGHRHLHWDVNKLSGRKRNDWEKILANPGWGGVSVPYRFRVTINGREKILNSKEVKCKWDDMSQSPWAGVESK